MRLRSNADRRFAFSLAEQLGCTVGELYDRMSSAEMTEWAAYYSLQQDEERLAEAAAEAKQRARRMAGGR